MELNIWHACICCQSLEDDHSTHFRCWQQFAGLWAHGGWVGDHYWALSYSKGESLLVSHAQQLSAPFSHCCFTSPTLFNPYVASERCNTSLLLWNAQLHHCHSRHGPYWHCFYCCHPSKLWQESCDSCCHYHCKENTWLLLLMHKLLWQLPNSYGYVPFLIQIWLEYFKAARWEQSWINTAKELVQDEFNQNYAHIKVPNEQEETLSNHGHESDVVCKTHLCFLFNS